MLSMEILILMNAETGNVSQIPIGIRTGITEAQASQMVEGLGITLHKADAMQQIKNLYTLFVKTDCTMVEVRPCIEQTNHTSLWT